MKAKLGLAALLLSVLFWSPGGPVAQLASARLQPLEHTPVDPASVTVPPQAPVVVPTSAGENSRGWAGSAAVAPTQDLTADVLAAYTLAVAVSPPQCHLTTPVLAAIGQVESGNLAGRTLDASHRVVPAILGPVLDGTKYSAVPDTDGGHWDHDTVWDRVLGPMQIIPATWRVVGLDMDGDGVRDPQNIYDSAGAAMVYLCSGGRDLATHSGLEQAILSYNQSPAYLRAVLAWTSVFAHADLAGIGAVPFVAALEAPAVTDQPHPSVALRTPASTTTSAAEPMTPSAPLVTRPSTRPSTGPTTPVTPATPGSTPTTPAKPTTPATPAAPTTADPAPATDPTPADPTPAGPTPADPTPADPTPADPTPADPPPSDPTPLPPCPVPTAAPTDQTDAPTPEQPVVSPETCTPPEGWQFDPATGLLVPVPGPTTAP